MEWKKMLIKYLWNGQKIRLLIKKALIISGEIEGKKTN